MLLVFVSGCFSVVVSISLFVEKLSICSFFFCIGLVMMLILVVFFWMLCRMLWFRCFFSEMLICGCLVRNLFRILGMNLVIVVVLVKMWI